MSYCPIIEQITIFKTRPYFKNNRDLDPLSEQELICFIIT